MQKNLDESAESPVSIWIQQLAGGDQSAAQGLWQHYCEQLMRFSRSRLDGGTRRLYDEEDASASAFRSLCRGIEARRFPDITDRSNLWALLIVIAGRKISNQKRYQNQQRRSNAQTVNESTLSARDGSLANPLDQFDSGEPTPAFAVEVADTSEHLLNMLPEKELQQLALLKFEGFTNDEAAEHLQVTRRTVQRKLERIRRIWIEAGAGPSNSAAAAEDLVPSDSDGVT